MRGGARGGDRQKEPASQCASSVETTNLPFSFSPSTGEKVGQDTDTAFLALRLGGGSLPSKTLFIRKVRIFSDPFREVLRTRSPSECNT